MRGGGTIASTALATLALSRRCGALATSGGGSAVDAVDDGHLVQPGAAALPSPVEPAAPSEPGCYVWMPLGCPDRPEVGSAYLTSWSRTMHTLPWRRDDKAEWRDRIKCEVERRQELDAWCGVPGTRMLFVPSGPGSSVGAYEASLLQVPFRLDDPAGPDSLPLLAPTPVAGATAEDFDEADEAEEAEEAPSAAPARSLGKLRARAADTRARTASYQQQREGQVVHTVDIDDFEAAPALQMSAVQVQQATEVEPQKSSSERDADQSTERASVEATEKVELEAQEKAEVGAHETLKAGSADRKAEREARDEAKREREAKRAERNAQRKAEREARERATATDNVHVAIDGVGSHAPEEADLNAQEVAEEAAERAQLAEFEAKRKAVSVVQTNALQSHQEAEADVVKPERDSSQMVEQSTERAEVEAKEKVVLEAEGKAEVEAHGTLKAGSADRKAEREAREEAKREREAKRAERNAQRKAEREARERAAAAANAEPPTGRAPTRVHVPSPKAAGCYLRLHHGCPLHPISTVVWHRVIAATDFHQCESAKGRMDTFCGHSKTSFYFVQGEVSAVLDEPGIDTSRLWTVTAEELAKADEAAIAAATGATQPYSAHIPKEADFVNTTEATHIAATATTRVAEKTGLADMGEARSVSEEPNEPKREGERVRKGDECRDAVVGDWCYRAVVRAQTKAIVEHPERYPGLTKDSPFSDFQAHFHKYGAATCGMPCPSRAKARAADHVTKLDTAADEASTRTTDDHDATAAYAEATTSSALVGHEAAEDRATTTTEVTMRPSPEGAVADGAAGSAAAGRPHKDASRNFAAWVDAMEAQTAGPVQVRHTERVADSSTSTDAAHSSAPTESSTATGHAESSSATTSTERGDKHSSNGSTAAGAAESSTIMESFTATEQGESNRQQPVDVRDNPDENHADISSASAAVDAAAAPKAREKAVLLDAGGPTDPSKDGPRAYPSKPGCMLWMHAGCPNHPRRAFKATWYMDKRGGLSYGACERRRDAYEKFCGSQNLTFYFVARAPRLPRPPVLAGGAVGASRPASRALALAGLSGASELGGAPRAPSAPGCFLWTGGGCPLHPSRSKPNWQRDGRGAGSSAACEQRRDTFDRYCQGSGTVFYYRGLADAGAPPSPTSAPPSLLVLSSSAASSRPGRGAHHGGAAGHEDQRAAGRGAGPGLGRRALRGRRDEATGRALAALQLETDSGAGHDAEGSSMPEQQGAVKHSADYNYQVDDFQMAGSRSGYLNFIKKYPCTRSPGPDGFPKKFDWIIHTKRDIQNVSKGKNPYAVFSSMDLQAVPAMLTVLETKWPQNKRKRVAYFTGDMMLSRLDKNFGKGTLQRLRAAFPGGIWWQAYDVRRPGFKVAPDGLNGMYLLPVWDVAEKAIGSATLEGKSKGVLAAWGKFHPNLDAQVPARRKLHEWVGTPGSIAAGVEHASFEPREYWSELAKYRFTLSPRGGGIQSPKNDEALLVLTIPISTREGSARGFKTEPAFDDLKKLGWPMVVLDQWSEITKPKLDEWWDELSPRLVSFRKNCLTTEGFWRIVTGQVAYCE